MWVWVPFDFPADLHDVFTTWPLIRAAVPVEHTPAHRTLGHKPPWAHTEFGFLLLFVRYSFFNSS